MDHGKITRYHVHLEKFPIINQETLNVHMIKTTTVDICI